MASSSSSFTIHQTKHDVFFSFRGDDTYDNFVSHIQYALARKKIRTFFRYDYDGLNGVDQILPSLEEIEVSKISVIIFSKNYASSTCCLDEVAKIIECNKRKGQWIVPVFYEVKPSDVRYQRGSFEKAFAEHELRFKDNIAKIEKWRHALSEAADLSGKESTAIRDESELVDEIVEDIFKKLNCKHDVFLCFRGQDTRYNFISHLHSALDRKEIRTIDDFEALKNGGEIAPTLMEAIKESKLSIIIFSTNFAESRWCLNELAKCLECKKMNGQIVIPVFYQVHPSDVRHQTGSFGHALRLHEQRFFGNKDQVEEWKEALTEAAKLRGFVSTNEWSEAEFVDKIVDNVSEKLDCLRYSSYCQGLAVIDTHIECFKFSISYWKQVTGLDLGCHNLTQIPEDICSLSSLERLNLRENNFKSLPINIKQLYRLKILYVMNCEMLLSIPELPLGLQHLDASNCLELQSLPEPPSDLEELDKSESEILSARFYEGSWDTIKFIFKNCLKLNQNSECWSQQRIHHMENAVLRLYQRKEFDTAPSISLLLPGSKIPNWFTHRSSGPSISIRLPQHCRNKRLIGFALSAVLAFEYDYCEENIGIECNYHFQTSYEQFQWEYFQYGRGNIFLSDHVIVGYSPCMIGKGDVENVMFEFATFGSYSDRNSPSTDFKVIRSGVYPLYEEANMTQPSISSELYFSATREDFDEIITNGTGIGISIEEEVEPPPNRIRGGEINSPLTEGCLSTIKHGLSLFTSFFRRL